MRKSIFKAQSSGEEKGSKQVNGMSTTQSSQKRAVARWATLKGVATIILFLIIAMLVEFIIIIYAMNLGLKDEGALQWSFNFPGTDWAVTLTVSPLFHLVPIAVLISLTFSWLCLAKYMRARSVASQRRKFETAVKRGQRFKRLRKSLGGIKSRLLKVKGIAYVSRKIYPSRITIKSALTVLLVFVLFTIFVSLLAYPNLIYKAIANAYANDPGLLNSIKGAGEFFGFLSPIANALTANVAPGFRYFALGVGSIVAPLADADNAGKYLAFQNAAAWSCALLILLYGEFRQRGFTHRKAKRK
jgi:hypothetical protein